MEDVSVSTSHHATEAMVEPGALPATPTYDQPKLVCGPPLTQTTANRSAGTTHSIAN